MVMPYSRSPMFIVRLECVMMMNCDSLTNSSTMRLNRLLFFVERGIDCRGSQTAGRVLKILMSSAIAVIDFSPPDISEMA